MTFETKKSMTIVLALASALGVSSVAAVAETAPAAKPAASTPAAIAPAAAKPAAAAPVAAAETATDAAPETAAAAQAQDAATEAPAPAAEAAPEAVPAPAATPAVAPIAPAKAAAMLKAADLSLGTPVVGADGKAVGKINRVRSGASGAVTEIHVMTNGKQGVVAVPGDKIASGGANVKLSLTADEVSKLPAIAGGKG